MARILDQVAGDVADFEFALTQLEKNEVGVALTLRLEGLVVKRKS